MGDEKQVSTKVTFKIEKYDYDLSKNVTVSKTFDKLNREILADEGNASLILDELGQLIVTAIDGTSLLDIIVTKQDSIL